MKNKANIFYVEDDQTLSFITCDNLQELGYQVRHFSDGKIAWSNFTAGSFDLCILDIMLPKMDGFELAERIRQTDKHIPILFLSAKSQQQDKIDGLTLGADDYLTKPFDMEELRLKIEVFLARNKKDITEAKTPLWQGIFLLEEENQTLQYQGKNQKLTYKEAKLMAYFFKHPNQLLTRQNILLHLWGDDSYFSGRSLDVYISKVRKYLKPDTTLEIENVHGTGFRLNNHAE